MTKRCSKCGMSKPLVDFYASAKAIDVLCHNCNTAKAVYGVCPHALEVPAATDLAYEEAI